MKPTPKMSIRRYYALLRKVNASNLKHLLAGEELEHDARLRKVRKNR